MRKLCLLGFCFLNLIASQSNAFVWTPKASYPIAGSYEPASFVLNDKVYVVGGLTGSGLSLTSTVWCYDPQSDTWSQKSNYPFGGIVSARSFVLNGFGYVMTGQGAGSMYTSSMYRYNDVTNSWAVAPGFTGFARYTGVAISINGKGCFGTGYQPLTSDWWEFDPSSGAWTQKANVPGNGRQSAAAFSINGFGYVGLGSFTQHPLYTPQNDLWQFNPVTNSWSAKTSFPQSGRWSCMTYVHMDEAYVGCGISYNNASGPYTYYSDFYKYNPDLDSWSFVGQFPSLRYGGVAAVTSSGVFAGLGYSGSAILSSWYKLVDPTVVEDLSSEEMEAYFNQDLSSIVIKPSDTYRNRRLQVELFDSKGALIIQDVVVCESGISLLPVSDYTGSFYILAIRDQSTSKLIHSLKILLD